MVPMLETVGPGLREVAARLRMRANVFSNDEEGSMSSNTKKQSLQAWFRVVMGAATIAVAAACASETATAPAELDVAVRAGVLPPGQAKKVAGLERNAVVSTPLTVSRLLTAKSGGSLALPDLDVTLTVPAGAIPRDTMTITMTVLPGKIVAYDFSPHGTVFLKPLTLSVNVKATKHELKKQPLFGGYFKSNSQVDAAKGQVGIDEVLSATLRGNTLRLNLWHFSGYVVATGFADEGI
jgi:hypothetical protein